MISGTISILIPVFQFLDGDVPRRTSYGVYISQFIHFARASSHPSDFNCRKKSLMTSSLNRAIVIIKLRKAFSKFIADTVGW